MAGRIQGSSQSLGQSPLQARIAASGLPGAPDATGTAPVPHPFAGSFAECKEQQLVFLLVRQLTTAQFQLAHGPMGERLWQEVAALEIDPERITALLYGGQDVNDREALRLLDEQWRSSHRPQRRGWFRRLAAANGAGRRSAPPAALRGHRPVR